MTQDQQTQAAHAMTLFILGGIIKALQARQPSFPWSVSEALLIPERDKLTLEQREGLKMAQQWVFEKFTDRAPPQ